MTDEPDAPDVEVADRPLRDQIDQMGLAIKAERARRGWSLRKLAEEAGVSASLLSAVETGKIVPTVASLFAVSDALGLPAESLFPAERRTAPLSGLAEGHPPGPRAGGHAPDSGEYPSATSPISPVPRAAGGSAQRAPHPVPDDVPRPPSVAATEPTDMPAKATGRDRDGATVRSPAPRRSLKRSSRRRQPTLEDVTLPAMRGRQSSDTVRPATETPPHDQTPPSAVTGPRGVATRSVPGFRLVRAADRPSMRLEGGMSWSLVSGAANGSVTVIEIVIPSGAGLPPRYTTHDRVVEVLVLSGRLIVEGGFTRQELVEGDAITVGERVPHRFGTSEMSSCRVLWSTIGPWDGRI